MSSSTVELVERASRRRCARGPLAAMLIAVGAPWLASGCTNSEDIAREHLRVEGLVDVELVAEAAEGAFSYHARRGTDRCIGNMTVTRWRGGRSISDNLSCRPDVAACDHGDAQSCHRLGLIYERGDDSAVDPTARDPDRAGSYFRKACEAGHGRACNLAGLRYAEAQGAAQDFPRAKQYFERSCAAGYRRGCYNLALSYSYGRGAALDAARAVELYRQACDGAVAPACYNLAVSYRDGMGVAPDAHRAAQRFDRACALGYLQSCVNLGVMTALGQGVARDEPRARALLSKACSGGLATGCQGLEQLDAEPGGHR